jgi:phosphopantetheinyl transferase
MLGPATASLAERFPDRSTLYVWHAAFEAASDEAAAAMTALLDAEERHRAAHFHFERHRHRFIAAHAFLRSVLAWHTGRDPAEIVFTRTARGKPLAPAIGLHFNLSHSHNAFVCAVAQQSVGVDIEHLRPMRDALMLARRFFSAAEVEALVGLEPDRLPLCFFSCWTRKGSLRQGHGRGSRLTAPSVHRLERAPTRGAALLGGRRGRDSPLASCRLGCRGRLRRRRCCRGQALAARRAVVAKP